jgi:hypothetical protein
MVNQGLRQLQETLNRKADTIQHEFIAVGETLHAMGRKIIEARPNEREALVAEQERLRQKRQTLAEEINVWRDRARLALPPMAEAKMRVYLAELIATGDDGVRVAAEQVLHYLDATDEELEQLAAKQVRARSTTPAGRLIERARTEFDLRAQDPAARQKAAFEFTNRTGMAQNDDALAELEAALGDADPIVNEVITLTLIQMHRFRAIRLADLDVGLTSTKRLTEFTHLAVIPALIEIAQTHRTGFTHSDNLVIESNNRPLREAAIVRLVAWNTPQSLAAVRARRQDRDSYIVEVANRALATVTTSA